MKYLVTHFEISAPDAELMQPSRELLAASLGECGFETFMDTDEGIDAYVQVDWFDETAMKNAIEDFPFDGVNIIYKVEEVEDQDWNATWEEEEGFEPIRIDSKLVVYDVLHTSDETLDTFTENIKIGIHAQNAFGTGTHETTRMMISSLLNMDLRGKRILDCGCGTGILAITALKCGAGKAVGYDIDEWSSNNTIHNAEINAVAQDLTVLQGDATVLDNVEGDFDVVLANINRNILLQDMPRFKAKMAPGATLLLSGFYADDVPLLKEKASELGLIVEEHNSDGDWQQLVITDQI